MPGGGLPEVRGVPGWRTARGRGVCRAGPAGAGGGVPGGVLAGAGGFPRAAARKTFFQKGPARMYKEAVAPVWARLVDKAIFPAILWWV